MGDIQQILLINPPFLKDNRSSYIPLGLVALASYLEFYGKFEKNISLLNINEGVCLTRPIGFDSLLNKFIRIIKDEIKSINPIIGFYTLASVYPLIIKTIINLKRELPQSRIVLGGPHVSFIANETVKVYGDIIDHVIIGEGEVAFLKYLERVMQNRPIEKIGHARLIDNLDILPELNLKYINLEFYKKLGHDYFRFPVESGRGCPFSCYYCSSSIMWQRKFRMKNVDRFINEIEKLHKTFQIESFDFVHDNITLNKDYIMQVCHEIKKRNLKMGLRGFEWVNSQL